MPLADATLFKYPADMPEELALLMTDILPTGYSAAMNARRLLDDPLVTPWTLADAEAGSVPRKGVAVVIGCGPVGLCAISSALTLFEKVFATDLHPARLELAAKHGATALPLEELRVAIKEATAGRGADAALEVVGHASAVTTALELIRPYGAVSSVGVHSRPIPLSGAQLYDTNARLQFGRCSVRTFFPLALNVLRGNIALFKTFVENKVDLGEAEEVSYTVIHSCRADTDSTTASLSRARLPRLCLLCPSRYE
jgi:threonine dehydrogenase-like Zn-dependent dehydrogenase